jgi:hypothetical protein
MADDQFSGKSLLNLVAAVCILTGLVGPIAMGHLFPNETPKVNVGNVIFFGWIGGWIFLGVLCAVGASTQERLTRIETRLGIRNPPVNAPESEPEPVGGANSGSATAPPE